jgi:hypothetical protein
MASAPQSKRVRLLAPDLPALEPGFASSSSSCGASGQVGISPLAGRLAYVPGDMHATLASYLSTRELVRLSQAQRSLADFATFTVTLLDMPPHALDALLDALIKRPCLMHRLKHLGFDGAVNWDEHQRSERLCRAFAGGSFPVLSVLDLSATWLDKFEVTELLAVLPRESLRVLHLPVMDEATKDFRGLPGELSKLTRLEEVRPEGCL